MQAVRRIYWILAALLGLAPLACLSHSRPAAADFFPGEPMPTVPLLETSEPVSLPCAQPPSETVLPINLPTALKLASAKPVDIELASERLRAAQSQLERANVLWLPNLYLGADWFYHDGGIQSSDGSVNQNTHSAFLVGGGPTAVFAITDAIFSPLAARQIVKAREATMQATTNDIALQVAETYIQVQQARGELAGAEETVRQADELVRRTEKLAPGLVPEVEAVRSRTERSRQRQAVAAARGRWQTASAELARLLRLEPGVLLVPEEPPHLQAALVPPEMPLDNLIATAMANRPELTAQQAVVKASDRQVAQEKFRPLIPSVLLRGAATNPTGIMSAGYFLGGPDSFLGNGSGRFDYDIEVLWELQNLGLGNLARVRERKSERNQAALQELKLQDTIAADVVKAHALAESAAQRAIEAQNELRDARESLEKNFEGMRQTRRLNGEIVLLVVRPAEVVAAIQALAQAYNDYFAAVADFNRAQFRLYHALGNPGRLWNMEEDTCPAQVVH
jgi:outer membrane protein TolC